MNPVQRLGDDLDIDLTAGRLALLTVAAALFQLGCWIALVVVIVAAQG
jgi:hypothetical protein